MATGNSRKAKTNPGKRIDQTVSGEDESLVGFVYLLVLHFPRERP
jgi:hypothetical protein